jgi:DNA-binding Lrp family transcriptional regulator
MKPAAFEPGDLDEKDIKILGCIKDHPRASVKAVRDELATRGTDIPYPTFQKRVQHLINVGALTREMSVNLVALGYELHFRVDVLVNPTELRLTSEQAQAKGKPPSGQSQFETTVLRTQREMANYIHQDLQNDDRFRDQILITDVHILLGTDVDLSIELFAKNYDIVTEFVTEGVRNIAGVQNTRTGWLASSVKHTKTAQGGSADVSD